jgi:hypothetical protein
MTHALLHINEHLSTTISFGGGLQSAGRIQGCDSRNRSAPQRGEGAMNWPGSLADWREGAVEGFPGERAVYGEITAIRGKDFRARREIGKGNDAGIRKVRLEIGEFSQPEQEVSRVECYVEFSAQVTVHKHFQKRFSGPDEMSGLGQNRRACEQGHIQRESSRPAVVDVILVKVGDQKPRVSDLRHDALPKTRALVSPFQSTDRAGAPSRQDTSRDSRSARSLQERLGEADRRATQAKLVAPQAAGPSRHPRFRQECSWPHSNSRAEAGQEGSAESGVPQPPILPDAASRLVGTRPNPAKKARNTRHTHPNPLEL